MHPGAVVILMSHGPNGNSAATVDGGVLQPPPATALNEAENVDPDQDFVDAAVSDDAATPYDDILIALSEAEFFAPLVAAQTAEDRTFTARKLVQRFTDALLIAALRSAAPPRTRTGSQYRRFATARIGLSVTLTTPTTATP